MNPTRFLLAAALALATALSPAPALAGPSCASDADCDDANACTLDVCSPTLGGCYSDPVGWGAGAFIQTRLVATASTSQARLGTSVAIRGELAAAGAVWSSAKVSLGGAVTIYRRGDTSFSEETTLTGDDTASNDEFGAAVAIDGGVVAVGAPQHDSAGQDAGAVYLFRQVDGEWTQLQKLVAPDAAASDWFGRSLSLSADTLVVGVPRDDDKGSSSGAAWVFEWDGIEWAPTLKLLASDGAVGDELGGAVAIDGDVIACGARSDDTQAGPNAGSVYVYRRDAAGWSQEQRLAGTLTAQFDELGSSVAVSGSRIIAGAPLHDVGTANDTGAAWVFAWDGTQWVDEGRLVGTGGFALDKLGSAVALDGDFALVGAPLFGDQGSSAGAVWVYQRGGAGWFAVRRLQATIPASTDEFGNAVALEGRRALVGANRDKTKSANSGAMWTFLATPPVLCEDDNPCTDAACEGDTGSCVFTAVERPCADGDPCTVGTLCDSGICQLPVGDVPCDDNNPCTDEACAPGQGCVRLPADGPCDDGDPCTVSDACDEGECVGAGELVCESDDNPCTADSCEAGVGCVYTPTSGDCDDADLCTVADMCGEDGGCAGTAVECKTPPALVCADDNTLRAWEAVGVCDSGSGECSYAPIDSPCPFGCADAACAAMCEIQAAGVSCDDKDPCTVEDVCDGAGGCAGAAKDCPVDEGPCVVGACDAASGNCISVTAANGLSCDDDNQCTVSTVCIGGACTNGYGVVCNDGDKCTTDTCAPALGCQATVIAGCCSAAHPCGTGEVCAAGGTCASKLCAACQTDAGCGTDGICATGPAEGFCTIACSAGSCPEGYTCDASGGDLDGHCLPDAGLPAGPTGCDEDGVLTRLGGCGEVVAILGPCNRGCVVGEGCCPEGTQEEGGVCVEVVVEPDPEPMPEEVPDAGGPDVTPDAGNDTPSPDTSDVTQPDTTPDSGGGGGGGCGGGPAPAGWMWLLVAGAALALRRRQLS